MKPLKKIISEALSKPRKKKSEKQVAELGPEIQQYIKKEIQRQLKKYVDTELLPEVKKLISETLRSELRNTNPSIPNDEEFYPPIKPVDAELPLILDEEILPLDEKPDEIVGTLKPDGRSLLSIQDIRLGIDFGTTTTAVSIRVGDEQPQALPIGRNGEKYMPSLVYFREGDEILSERVLVGEDAQAMSLNDPAHVIRSIKRCFGCNGKKCGGNGADQEELKFPWCNGKGKIQATTRDTLLPSDVAFFIIQEALNRAVSIIKENNNTDLNLSNVGMVPLNMGCGARFDLMQRQGMLENAISLGFSDIKVDNVVEEPILAGLAFSRFAELARSEGRTLIYDFGGGTLDIAVIDVVRKADKPFVTILSTAGDNWLGGDDIDKLVLDEFIDQISAELNVTAAEIMKELTIVDLVNLRNMAKTAKERLSNTEQYRDSLNLEQLGLILLTLSREKFESILSNSRLIQRSFDAVLKALKLAYTLDVARENDLLNIDAIRSLKLENAVQMVDRVVLVGGVTKIPLIQHEMERLFGEANVIEENVFDPISAVSIGAAYPREADHFSISSPPYGFYLEGMRLGKKTREWLLAPYTYLDFFKDLHISSIPAVHIPLQLDDVFSAVALKGWEPFNDKTDEIKDLPRLEPGIYQFNVGFDGSLSLTANHIRPHNLGMHRYAHPLQELIKEKREQRHADANRYPDRSLGEDYKRLMNEN